MPEKFNLDKYIEKQSKKPEADEALQRSIDMAKDRFDDGEIQKKYYEENFPEESNETIEENPDLEITSKKEINEEEAREILERINDRDSKISEKLKNEWQDKNNELQMLKKAFKQEYLKNMKTPSEKTREIHDKIVIISKELEELSKKLREFITNREELN